jgi:hypothetical protein
LFRRTTSDRKSFWLKSSRVSSYFSMGILTVSVKCSRRVFLMQLSSYVLCNWKASRSKRQTTSSFLPSLSLTRVIFSQICSIYLSMRYVSMQCSMNLKQSSFLNCCSLGSTFSFSPLSSLPLAGAAFPSLPSAFTIIATF